MTLPGKQNPKSHRMSSVFRVHLPIHILALLALWIVLNAKAWMIVFAFYMGGLAVMLIGKVFRRWCDKRQKVYAHHCKRLETLLHDVLDMAYIYENDHEKFYLKFIESVSVSSLTRRGIISPDAMLRTSRHNRSFEALKRSDAELLALLAAGFSNREIKVIYGLKNLNSVYIKSHRLRERLSYKMQQLLEERQSEAPKKNARSKPVRYRRLL